MANEIISKELTVIGLANFAFLGGYLGTRAYTRAGQAYMQNSRDCLQPKQFLVFRRWTPYERGVSSGSVGIRQA